MKKNNPYKQAKKQEISVGKFCSIVLSEVRLVDNGDGHTISCDTADAIAAGEYADGRGGSGGSAASFWGRTALRHYH